MRTIYPVVIALSLGVASIMFGLSGAAAIFDQSPPNQVGENVEDEAGNSSVNDGIDTDAQSEGGLLGFIRTGTSTILGAAKMILAVPIAMQQLGFPYWFAYPLGTVMEIIVGIGVIQFLTGRVWR